MSFTGDLQHLPIVDVIQLLNQTRKSGILHVMSRKGECQLVFKDGGIVSATHLNIRIGQVLIQLGLISAELLEATLQEQQAAGSGRKPLIVTLLEKGVVNERDAYKGLERLIEETVVEILTWKKGTFTLDVIPTASPDDYRFYPQPVNREINVDAQGVLMDALRIFDEKVRDGELSPDGDDEDDAGAVNETPYDDDPVISIDDLGLGELDQLERNIPEVFMSLDDRPPVNPHREKIASLAPWLPEREMELLAEFLASPAEFRPDPLESSVVFCSNDPLLGYCLAASCKREGISVFTTDVQQELESILGKFRGDGVPLLVFDAPDPGDPRFSPQAVAEGRRNIRRRYPAVRFLQFVAPGDNGFALATLADGIVTAPRPPRGERPESCGALLPLLAALPGCLRFVQGPGKSGSLRVSDSLRRLREERELPAIALGVLQTVALLFPRCVTLVVREGELMAERGIGLDGSDSRKPGAPLGHRFPLQGAPLFRRVIADGDLFLGSGEDAGFRPLETAYGKPALDLRLLLPLRRQGRTIALIYADFGAAEHAEADAGLLEIVAGEAELLLDTAAHRNR